MKIIKKSVLKLMIVLLGVVSFSAFAQDSTENSNPAKTQVWGANQLQQKVFVTFQVHGVYVPPEIPRLSSMHKLDKFSIVPGQVTYYTNVSPSQTVICGTLPLQKVHNLMITAYQEGSTFKCRMRYN